MNKSTLAAWMIALAANPTSPGQGTALADATQAFSTLDAQNKYIAQMITKSVERRDYTFCIEGSPIPITINYNGDRLTLQTHPESTGASGPSSTLEDRIKRQTTQFTELMASSTTELELERLSGAYGVKVDDGHQKVTYPSKNEQTVVTNAAEVYQRAYALSDSLKARKGELGKEGSTIARELNETMNEYSGLALNFVMDIIEKTEKGTLTLADGRKIKASSTAEERTSAAYLSEAINRYVQSPLFTRGLERSKNFAGTDQSRINAYVTPQTMLAEKAQQAYALTRAYRK